MELYSGPKGGGKKMNPATRSAFKSLHDLLRLSGEGTVTREIPLLNLTDLAKTVWSDELNPPIKIPWFDASFATFLHRDLFLRIWNRSVARTRTMMSEQAALKEYDFSAILIGAAIAATLIPATVIFHKSPNTNTIATKFELKICESEKTKNAILALLSAEKIGGWWHNGILGTKTFFQDVAALAREALDELIQRRTNGLDDARADHLEKALVNVFTLLAPEVCLPLKLTDGVDFKSHTITFCPSEIFFTKFFEKMAPEMDAFFQSEIASTVRTHRVRRFGSSLPTNLAVTFLRTDHGHAMSNTENHLDYICQVIEMIERSFPGYGGVGGGDRRDIFAPGDQVLKSHVLATVRARTLGEESSTEAGALGAYFSNLKKNRQCITDPSNRPPSIGAARTPPQQGPSGGNSSPKSSTSRKNNSIS